MRAWHPQVDIPYNWKRINVLGTKRLFIFVIIFIIFNASSSLKFYHEKTYFRPPQHCRMRFEVAPLWPDNIVRC